MQPICITANEFHSQLTNFTADILVDEIQIAYL